MSDGHRIGDALLELGLLSPARLSEALRLQKAWGSRLGDVVLGKGWVRAFDFYRALARHLGRPFVDLLREPPDPGLLDPEDIPTYADLLILPWRRSGEGITVALADPSEEVLDFLRARYGDGTDFVVTSKFDIIWQLQEHGNALFTDRAVDDLYSRHPDQSARQVFTGRQLVVVGLVSGLFVAGLILWPVPALVAANGLISLYFLLNLGLRAVLTWVGGDKRIDVKVTPEMVASLEDRDLPTYTVLVPMYKEAKTLPILTSALRRLDYPMSKLDIKLILEEDDTETIAAAKDLGLEGIFEIIRVPPSEPKTKPKACNYALHFARGELLTIYDAEDKPEADQLKKVVAAFRHAPDNVACIQARLNYFNSEENWLTRMFTLEYSLWFDFYLPALEALRIPIPLGGTSNHFKIRLLREVNGWDPYNVTEDADLGVRITQRGLKVGVVNSTTFEEANSRVGNWIRQRSRWIKGYMQTYLVHMRRPRDLYRTVGGVGFWGFQLFIGGTVINALVLPVLFGLYLFWLVTETSAFDPFFPPVVLYASLFNLLLGNGFFMYVFMVGAIKRGYFRLVPYALTAPLYYVLMSIAGYKALWQLIQDPFHWEKTTHGLSRFEHHDLELHGKPSA
jgi:cellulose synthase/poly-beta-1,6-N-acetylglucosamine synthase-like glycosyltransferase